MSTIPKSSILCLFPEQTIDGLEDFRQQYINHPGKSVPFHITLISDFLNPDLIDDLAARKLKDIARETSRFEFMAKPLSSFPATNVLYLTPSPVTPIEELSTRLYRAFPGFYNPQFGFPVYHMTLALSAQAQTGQIIDEYFSTFGKEPLQLRAHHLGVCAQYGDQWHHCMSFKLGS